MVGIETNCRRRKRGPVIPVNEVQVRRRPLCSKTRASSCDWAVILNRGLGQSPNVSDRDIDVGSAGLVHSPGWLAHLCVFLQRWELMLRASEFLIFRSLSRAA